MSLSLAGMPANKTLAARPPADLNDPEFVRAHRVALDLTWFFDAPNQPQPLRKADLEALAPAAVRALEELKAGTGDCLDGQTAMLGWQDLPARLSADYLDSIVAAAGELASRIDAYVSLGIGGSYLGIEATLKALGHTFANHLERGQRGGPEIYFLGQNLDPDFLRDTLDVLEGKRVGINVISKSGTTTETAIAFRFMRRLMEESYGAAAADLTFVTTDAQKGALRQLAQKKGYQTFVVPDDVGGRYSILTEVGLVGLAVGGVDIHSFVAGFEEMRRRTETTDFWSNPALVLAAARIAAHQAGKQIEVVATNSAALFHLARWMEQLFPESEGHDGKGLWLSPSLYSEKLHANGQMVQDGRRNLIETFLYLAEPDNSLAIPPDPEGTDGLNYLSEKGARLEELNRLVIDGPAYAHHLAGVPNLTLRIPRRHPFCLGQVYYLMERSVAVSGYLLGVNPFVQPGVEAYKQAVFALAGRPGYEEEGRQIAQALAERERILI